MARNGRKPDGTFARGHRLSPGRPPRNYSIAHALSVYAEEATTTDDGETLTRAQWAARWLWSVVSSGRDRNQEVSFRDRLQALQTILSRIEPEYKLKPEDMADLGDEAREVAEQVAQLSPAELQVLAKIGVGEG